MIRRVEWQRKIEVGNMNIKNLKLLIISVCISLVMVEIGLRCFTVFPIHSRSANILYDDKLSYKMDPSSLEDIDSNGFRNPGLLEKVDIVVLGDSQTFGYNVSSENSWPQQLASIANRSVYNFGVGGYGSLQYHYLMDEAIELNPDHIILGLYLVNDLNDTCALIRDMDYWDRWANEQGYDAQLCSTYSDPTSSPGQSNIFSLIHSTVNQTAIGSLTTYVWNRASAKLAIACGKKSDSDSLVINMKLNKTKINSSKIDKHERYTDLTKEDISLSFEITKKIIKNATERSKLNDIHFGVVFIPSKERVFFDYLTKKGRQLPKNYHKLIFNENTLVDRYSSFFEKIEIKFVDAKPYVEKELYKSGAVYPYTGDDHPLEIGYKAYAQAVYEKIIVGGNDQDEISR